MSAEQLEVGDVVRYRPKRWHADVAHDASLDSVVVALNQDGPLSLVEANKARYLKRVFLTPPHDVMHTYPDSCEFLRKATAVELGKVGLGPVIPDRAGYWWYRVHKSVPGWVPLVVWMDCGVWRVQSWDKTLADFPGEWHSRLEEPPA